MLEGLNVKIGWKMAELCKLLNNGLQIYLHNIDIAPIRPILSKKHTQKWQFAKGAIIKLIELAKKHGQGT